MPTLKVINLSGEESSLDATSGETLMEALRDNGYDEILAICGGVCSCASCHVYIEGEWKDNRRDGFGKLILSECEYYEGTFLKGYKSGQGL